MTKIEKLNERFDTDVEYLVYLAKKAIDKLNRCGFDWKNDSERIRREFTYQDIDEMLEHLEIGSLIETVDFLDEHVDEFC